MHPAKQELCIAAEAVKAMANETNFSGFQRAWTDFLFRLERTWEFCRREAERLGPHGQTWLSKYAHLRKKDSLICYLKHARDAETHAVGPTIDHDITISLHDSLGRPFHLESVEHEFKDGVLTVAVQSPNEHLDWRGEILPGDPKLLRFKSRSAWYNPPHEHSGDPITNIHPVDAAMLGLKFYRGAVSSLLEKTTGEAGK